MIPTKLTVILKTGEVMTYSDADVEERSGSCRLRVQRDGTPLDSFHSEDVERWFVEPLGTRSRPDHRLAQGVSRPVVATRQGAS